MLVDIKEMRLFRKAVYGMKPEWKVQYVYKGDTFVQWIHADDEVGVYAEILRGYADADSQRGVQKPTLMGWVERLHRGLCRWKDAGSGCL